MKLLISSIFIILMVRMSLSQTQKIFVLDSLNLLPIPNALLKTSEGKIYYSDSEGRIFISKKINSSIKLLQINYYPKSLVISSKIDTILMIKKPKMFDEVIITTNNKNYDYTKIGYVNSEKRRHQTLIINNLSIIAVYIPYPKNGNNMISKILMKLAGGKYAKSYNIYLFKPDTSGKPGEVIYYHHFKVDKLTEKGIINIEDLQIKVPKNGIYIGLENLKVYKEKQASIFGKGIGVRFRYTNSIDSSKVYVLIKDFKKESMNNIWFKRNYSPDGPITPCFGLEVYNEK